MWTPLLLLASSLTSVPALDDPRPALTWEAIPGHLEAAAERGFSGTVLLVRDGEVVLEEGYGLADRERGIPCTPDTIYAIGSTPIDFTRAAVLLLVEGEELALDEALPAFFGERVPADKRAITVEHLMTGASGLRDFHDLPGDRDPDHHWIDREEAVRRILAHELLFEPGTDRRHSHSAWGLLAAIVELRSGSSYPEFVRERLLRPLGMASTEFFGVELPDERVAVGYGMRTTGEVNKPTRWGPTSWLVMGSGGMVSTARDLYRWNTALGSGELLAPESLARYWAPPGALLDGGDMWGFEIVYTEGPGTFGFVLSNSVGPETRDLFFSVAEPIGEFLLSQVRPSFTLGISLEVEAAGVLLVGSVAPGSPAAAAGVQPRDVIALVDGRSPWPDPMAVLAPALNAGAKVELTLTRGGEQHVVQLLPARR